jgi:Cys-tRNA(Pro) deacylase
MHDTVARVQHFFTERGLYIELITFATRVHTAQQAAEALGVPIQQIVKSLVFEADGQPVLVLCSGDRRVDTARLGALCNARQVQKASAAVTKRATGYSIGGVPPVAHATALPVFMDTDLLACETVYAAAGTAQTLFAIAPEILKACSGAQVASLSEA